MDKRENCGVTYVNSESPHKSYVMTGNYDSIYLLKTAPIDKNVLIIDLTEFITGHILK